MTSSEYERLFRQATRQFPLITRQTLAQMKSIYIQASKEISAIILEAQLSGKSALTTASWNAINNQLLVEIENIGRALQANVESMVFNTSNKLSSITSRFLEDITQYTNGLITSQGIASTLGMVNNNVVLATITRLYSDGYSFAERCWKVGEAYAEQVRRVITSGLAQGRDMVKIAKDLQVYTKDGKVALVNRYGDLVRGTSDFVKRIGNKVDWRALRLIRSEMYASMQQAAKWQGLANPASNGLYAWVRGGTQDWGCECPENAKNSPYTYKNVPSFPHPNCLCRIIPLMRSYRAFIKDLKAWGNGARIDYMDNWYSNFYVA